MAKVLELGNNGKFHTKKGGLLAHQQLSNTRFVPQPFKVDRLSEASLFGEDGLLFWVENDVPRVNFPQGESIPSILTELQATNLLPDSNDFSAGSWSKIETDSTVTVTTNTILSPEGLFNADEVLISLDNTTTSQGTLGFSFAGADDYTHSIWIKTDTPVTIMMRDPINSGVYVFIDITTSWQRFCISGTAGATTAFQFGLRAVQSNLVTLATLHCYGAQLETGNKETSNIRSSGGSSTRLQDQITEAGDVNNINSSEGVLFIETKAIFNSNTDRIFSLSDGTTTNRIYIFFDTNNDLRFFIVSGGVFQVTETALSIDILNKNKIAISWSSTEVLIYVNGINTNTVLSITPPIGLNTLNLSRPNGISSVFESNTYAIQVFNTSLTTQELIELTT